MLFAQITDCHIGAAGFTGLDKLDVAANLRRCIDHILGLSKLPDAVLATGDLVNTGAGGEYRELRDCLAPLKMPVYIIPGNHDERGALRRAFADHDYLPDGEGPINYLLDLDGPRFIFLDTVLPGEDGGRLGTTQLGWLGDRLDEAPATPTVIVMHHPPFDIGLRRMDRINCEDGQALARILAGRGQIMRLLCGHTHRYTVVDFAGAIGIAAPSTAVQLEVRLGPGDEAGWSATEPPAYLLHDWRGGGGFTTHLCQVPR